MTAALRRMGYTGDENGTRLVACPAVGSSKKDARTTSLNIARAIAAQPISCRPKMERATIRRWISFAPS